MKKPKKPSQPNEPKRPSPPEEAFIVQERIINDVEDYTLVGLLQRIGEHFMVLPGEKLSDEIMESLDFVEEECWGYYSGDQDSRYIHLAYNKKVPNQNFEHEMKLFEKKMVTYKKDMAEYNKALKVWSERKERAAYEKLKAKFGDE